MDTIIKIIGYAVVEIIIVAVKQKENQGESGEK